jgi:hypothetical protein
MDLGKERGDSMERRGEWERRMIRRQGEGEKDDEKDEGGEGKWMA